MFQERDLGTSGAIHSSTKFLPCMRVYLKQSPMIYLAKPSFKKMAVWISRYLTQLLLMLTFSNNASTCIIITIAIIIII